MLYAALNRVSREANLQMSRECVSVPFERASKLHIGLLTGGDDRPYALGMAGALISQGIYVDFIASDQLKSPELEQSPLLDFKNLRGNQSPNASFVAKAKRIALYYLRLLQYATTAKPKVLHILWNNKYEFVDRVALMIYYRLLGKRVVLTAHNVNAAKRDRRDSVANRATLRVQYSLSHHIFVHTERMKQELISDFRVSPAKITVIPFGINNTIPVTGVTREESRLRLGLETTDKVLLFFGQIAPYKGLEYLVAALDLFLRNGGNVRLVIAGKVKQGSESYWTKIQARIAETSIGEKVVAHIRFIPDHEVEIYLKSADALALPYVDIFQSGVPFLAYSFGVPVIATDVGSLRDDIVAGVTGVIARPCDPSSLADAIRFFFESTMYRDFPRNSQAIRNHANERHSWGKVGAMTQLVYESLLSRR